MPHRASTGVRQVMAFWSRVFLPWNMTQMVRVRRSPRPVEEFSGSRTLQASWSGRAPASGCSPHSVERLASLQRTAGNQAVSALLAGATVQRLVGKDDLWDRYHDAYWARMNAGRRVIDGTWTQRFFLFEQRLYAAKGQEAALGTGAYAAVPVQDAHDRLHELGFHAPAPAEDPDVVASRAVFRHAAGRWAAFRGDAGLNRGAWAGSSTHGGRPADYVQTAAAVVDVIRQRQVSGGGRVGAWWLMVSDSAPSGHALHRGGIDYRGDFIYHL